MHKVSRLVCSLLVIFSAGQSAATELETIIVTATKEAKNVNDISLTVKTFDGDEIADLGIVNPAELAKYTPGLNIKPTVGDQNPVMTMRGIGFNDFSSIQNPGTGVYVDQVIVPFHSMMSFQLLDLERIEVLKGPQGTLYGRNSTAGAINFISVKPEQEFSGKVRVDLSRWDTTNVEFAVGGGLTGDLSARLAYSHYERNDSYQKNRSHPEDDIGEKKRNAYRLSFRWHNDSSFDALLNFHGGKDESAQVALEHLSTVDAATFIEPCAPVAEGRRAEGECINYLGYFDPDNDEHAGDYSVSNAGVDNDSHGVGLTMNWQLSKTLTFTSVTGYDEFDRDQLQDIDASPVVALDVTFTDKTESFSQEFRLTGSSEELSWLAGFFFSDDSVKAHQELNTTEFLGGDPNTDLITADVYNNQDSKSKALFVNTNMILTDTLNVLLGLRYTDEEKDWDGGTAFAPLGIDNFSKAKIDDNDLSGQLGLEYRPYKDWLFYGTYSKGFRSGGFPGGFAPTPDNLTPFDSEQVFAYELGFKGTLFYGKVQLNTVAYFYDWRDLQTQFSEVRSGLASLFLTNAGDADIKGLEVDFDWAVTDQLMVYGGFNLMSTEVSSSDPRLDNKELANAPDLTYNLNAEYYLPVAGRYELLFAADISYTDKRYFTSDNEAVFHDDDYLLSNARVSLIPKDDDWRLTLWGRNLGDTKYRLEGFNQFGFSGDSYFTYGEPLSYGISFYTSF